MKKNPIVVKWPLEGRGLTLYPFIFAHKDWESTFKHEMKHWHQIQALGVFGFYKAILREYWRHGPNDGPMEMVCEAYEREPLTAEERELWDEI